MEKSKNVTKIVINQTFMKFVTKAIVTKILNQISRFLDEFANNYVRS